MSPSRAPSRASKGCCKVNSIRNVLQTLALYYGFFALGMSMTVCGPALPELEVLVSRTTSEISWMFSGRAAGMLLGSLVCGAIDGRVGIWLQLGTAQMVIAGMMVAIPMSRSLVSIIISNIVNGICAGVISSGSTMTILKIWSIQNGPWMQGLHCQFGVGAILCPFIVNPFLSIKNHFDDAYVTPSANQTSSKPSITASTNQSLSVPDITALANQTSVIPDIIASANQSSAISNSTLIGGKEVNETLSSITTTADIAGSYLLFGFLIFGSIAAMSGLMFYMISCTDHKKDWLSIKVLNTVDQKDNAKTTKQELCACMRILFLILVFLFYFCYFITETNTSSYMVTFILRHAKKSKTLALHIMSGYWLTFTAGRALGALVIKNIQPRVLLWVDIVLVLLFVTPLMFSVAHITWVLWLCSMSVGFFMATIVSGGITWVGTYIDISGSLGAMFAVSGAVGEMVGSPLTGWLFGVFGPVSYAYVMVGTMIFMVLVFIGMQIVAGQLKKSALPRHDDLQEKSTFI